MSPVLTIDWIIIIAWDASGTFKHDTIFEKLRGGATPMRLCYASQTLSVLEEQLAISHGPESQPTSGRRYLARLIEATATNYTVYRLQIDDTVGNGRGW
jgi:hypothetical protein